jgi:hypothetical protein
VWIGTDRQVHNHTSGLEHLICFYNTKNITFRTLELVHQIERFTVSKGGDRIGQFVVMFDELLGGLVKGTRMLAGIAKDLADWADLQ